jgi:hypothetical protein
MIKEFVKWMKFNPPYSDTPEGWDEFYQRYKEAAPVRYFMMRTLPKRAWRPLSHRIRKIADWFRYRAVGYHRVNNRLEPAYYDTDTILLHTSFEIFVNFVETELARNMERWDKLSRAERILSNFPFYTTFKDRYFRSPELGLSYLEWASGLDGPDLDEYERSDTQAKAAREMIKLYIWWKDVRPYRDDSVVMPEECAKVYSERSWSYLMDHARFKKEYPLAYSQWLNWSDQHQSLEERSAKEDTEMLHRLIDVRTSLWT